MDERLSIHFLGNVFFRGSLPGLSPTHPITWLGTLTHGEHANSTQKVLNGNSDKHYLQYLIKHYAIITTYLVYILYLYLL